MAATKKMIKAEQSRLDNLEAGQEYIKALSWNAVEDVYDAPMRDSMTDQAIWHLMIGSHSGRIGL